jgi:uncharacterized membrane protein YwzB
MTNVLQDISLKLEIHAHQHTTLHPIYTYFIKSLKATQHVMCMLYIPIQLHTINPEYLL